MPFFWITTLFIAGIITANQTSYDGSKWYIFCGLTALLGFSLFYIYKRGYIKSGWLHSISSFLPGTRLPFLLLPFCFTLGASLFHLQQPADTRYTIFGNQNQGSVLIRGVIFEPPDRREKLTLVKIQAAEFTNDQGATWKTNEKLMVFLSPDSSIQLGDEIVIRGKPITPQEDANFSYRQYLAAENIFTQIMYPQLVDSTPGPIHFNYYLYQFREKSLGLLSRIFPAPESSLVQGILLGDESAMPADLDDSFRRSGTSHLIAISGFNIAIVSSLITLLFASLLGKWRGTAAAIISISLYTILVGANPPVVRAAIMGSLSLMGLLIGRRNGGLNALFLTAGIMLAFRPFLLWSISFQLSAAATLGLVLFASPIQRILQQFFSTRMEENLARKVSSGLGEYFFYTIAAQITTLPILLHHFHQFPWVTLLANPLVLPLQPPLMITSGAALILGWIHPVLGQIAALVSMPFITLTIKLVTWAGTLDFPSLAAPQVSYSLILIWLCLLCLPLALPVFSEKLRRSWKPAFTIVIMLTAAYGFLHTAVDRPDGRLHLFFSGNKKNPAILLISPSGESFLVHPGSSANELFAFIDPRLPFPQRNLDGMLVIPGVNIRLIQEIVPVLSPKNLFLLGERSPTDLLDLQPGTNENSTQLPDGGTLDFGDDLRLTLIPGGRQPATVFVSWQNLQVELVLEKSTHPPACEGNILFITDSEANLSPTCHPQIWISTDYGINAMPDVVLAQTGWLHISSDGNQVWMKSQK